MARIDGEEKPFHACSGVKREKHKVENKQANPNKKCNFPQKGKMQQAAFPPPPGWKYYPLSTQLNFAVRMGSGDPG